MVAVDLLRKIGLMLLLMFLAFIERVYSQNECDKVDSAFIEEIYNMSLEELLSVKITSATKFEESIKDLSFSIYLITRKDIETYGYLSVAEALQHVPGLYMLDDHNMYKENFGFRGIYRDEWNQNIIFLVNGIRQRSGYDFNNKLVYINVPISSVERIEVIKGPSSVTYGSGAFFGVINIITTCKETVKSDVSASVGTQNTYQMDINLRKCAGDLKVGLNAGFYTTDGIDQNYADMGLDTSLSSSGFMKERRAFMALTAKKGAFYSALSIDRNFSTRPIISPPTLSSIYESENDFMAMRFLMGVNYSFTEKLEFNSSIQYQFQEEEFLIDAVGTNNDQETQNATVDQIEFEINTKYAFTKELKLSAAVNLFYVPRCKDQLDFPAANLTNTYRELIKPLSMFGSSLRLDWSPLEKIQLKGGVRLDLIDCFKLRVTKNRGHNILDPDALLLPLYSETIYTYPENKPAFLPELSFIYHFNSKNHLKFIYGEAINRPPIYRLHNTAEFGIKPEYIRSMELNYLGIVNDKLRINTSLVYSYLYDLIINDFIIDGNGAVINTLRNGGNVSVVGFESEIDYRATDNLRFQLSGNYYYTVNENHPEVDPAFSPDFLATFDVSYQWETISLALTNHFVSNMEPKFNFEPSDPGNINSPPIGRAGKASPAYINTGLNVIYKPAFANGAFLNLRVSNLFDQKMYSPVNDFNPWATNGTLGISRTFLFTLGYKF